MNEYKKTLKTYKKIPTWRDYKYGKATVDDKKNQLAHIANVSKKYNFLAYLPALH
jgi:hypothetical protein